MEILWTHYWMKTLIILANQEIPQTHLKSPSRTSRRRSTQGAKTNPSKMTPKL
jgi:hypothetical protein